MRVRVSLAAPSMNFMKKSVFYLITIFISSLIGLYAFESYLVFNNLEKTNIQNIIEKMDLLKENKKNKITIRPSLNIKNKKIDLFPLSGFSDSRTINCNENGYYSIYQSDRYGFNNPDENWDSDEIEFLLIGDSFTHGSCVNRPDDIASVLGKLSNKNVINLGYNANGPLIELASLKEYWLKNTKKILWIYYEGNDLYNLSNEIKSPILKRYLLEPGFKQNLKTKQKEINKKLEINLKKIIDKNRILVKNKNFQKEKNLKIKSRVLKFLRLDKTKNFLISMKRFSNEDIKNFKRVMISANDFAKINNSKLYFIYLPEFSRYKRFYLNNSYSEIKNIIKELNITFVDIHSELFKNEKNPLKLFSSTENNSHYNVDGYKKVSEIIFNNTKN